MVNLSKKFLFGWILVLCFVLAESHAQTSTGSQLKGLSPWSTTPLFTIGESVSGYTPPGILDGVGARKLSDGTVRAYINSELGASAGYTYQLANGTSLKGGR
ncbi:MAG: hypothetical protein ACKV1O_02925, partial [Saprospiraceae bacterium]